MTVWEIKVNESKKNLWLVVTSVGLFLCVKFRGRFFVKDCDNMLPVKGEIESSEKL